MSPAHFDKNLTVEKKAIRFTVLFQITALLLLIVLVLIGDKSLRGPTILLGILSLLEIIGFFGFLFIRFRFNQLVKQKNQLVHLHNDLKRQIDKTRSNLAVIKRQRQQIIDRSRTDQENRKTAYHQQDFEFDKRRRDLRENEKRQLDDSLNKTQQSFIDNGLRGTRLDNAQISGIGPKMKEKLARAGITSAWDISAARIMRISGFGEAKARSLTA